VGVDCVVGRLCGFGGEDSPGDGDADDPSDADGAGTDDTGAAMPTTVVGGDPVCEPLAEGACMLPWPSDRYLIPQFTHTGWKVEYEPEAAWINVDGVQVDVSPFGRLDGFSPSSQILTIFDEPADTAGTAFWDSIDRSLDDDHPTVLLDVETGERLPHWIENDARATDPGETILFIRPTVRLDENHRYAVAIRDLSGVSGERLGASPGFAALRDGVLTEREDIERRRLNFEDLFVSLEEAGIARESLQQAWWFHTASDETTRLTMKQMREDALTRLGSDGLGCTITEVNDAEAGGRVVKGTITVPWYMDAPLPPASIVRSTTDAPEYQGTEEIVFAAYVPASLIEAATPGPLVVWGHGLFGSGPPMMESTGIQQIGEDNGLVQVATDWHGMSSKDLVFLMTALWDVSKFNMLGENLQQAMVIQNTLTRSMLGTCGLEDAMLRADGGRSIDPETRYFIGVSQGSILGGTFLTQSPDIDRGSLIVGGANFSFMIERSIHFNTYEGFLTPAYGSRLVTGQLMAFSQHVWDQGESAAYLGAADEGLWDAGPKKYLYMVAENDSQVPNLSSDIAVRMTGLPVLADSSYIPWGSTVIDGPTTESAFISIDMGDRETPRGNDSPDEDDGGHNTAALTDEGVGMILHFFETGEIASTCDGPCVLY
jgi:hypothetical protein